jgi:hypothetical protein
MASKSGCSLVLVMLGSLLGRWRRNSCALDSRGDVSPAFPQALKNRAQARGLQVLRSTTLS